METEKLARGYNQCLQKLLQLKYTLLLPGVVENVLLFEKSPNFCFSCLSTMIQIYLKMMKCSYYLKGLK